MTRLGLVYKKNNQAYLGVFEDSVIYDFQKLEDNEGHYDDLQMDQFRVVNLLDEFDLPDMSLCAIQFVSTISMIDRSYDAIDVEDFLFNIGQYDITEYEEFMRQWHTELQSMA